MFLCVSTVEKFRLAFKSHGESSHPSGVLIFLILSCWKRKEPKEEGNGGIIALCGSRTTKPHVLFLVT